MPLTRLQQLFIAEEPQEGVIAPTLFTAANGDFINYDSSIDYNPNFYERSPKRQSLTPLQGLSGQQKATAKFRLELAGTASIGTPPKFGRALKACGFRQETLIKLTIGSITGGPFKHGELATQLTSGATGTVVADTYNGQTTMWVAKGNSFGRGQPADLGNGIAFTTTVGQTISGGSSGAATVAAPTTVAANAGIGWWPQSFALANLATAAGGVVEAIQDGDLLKGLVTSATGAAYGAYSILVGAQPIYVRRLNGHFNSSEIVQNQRTGNTSFTSNITEIQYQIPTVSIGLAKDGVREQIKYARGTVNFSGSIGEPMFMDFEFNGAGGSGEINDGGNVSGIIPSQVVPAVLLDADLGVGKTTFGVEHIPCIKQINFGIGNDVQFGECMADATGLTYTDIIGRKPSGSFDPELNAEGTFDWMSSMLNNQIVRARFSTGATLGNKFLITMPGLTFKSIPTGDRNGKAIRTVNFDLNGGTQSSASTNSDNELVIILQYA